MGRTCCVLGMVLWNTAASVSAQFAQLPELPPAPSTAAPAQPSSAEGAGAVQNPASQGSSPDVAGDDVYGPYPKSGAQPSTVRELDERNRNTEDAELAGGLWDHADGSRFEHQGFFLRLTLGPTLAYVRRPDYRWSGGGVSLGIAVGGAVIDNLVVHADFRGTLIFDPTEHAFGRRVDFGADLVFQSMGAGVTYYFMPANVYIGAGLGVGLISFENDSGASKDTSAGLTLNANVGKEWWIGSEWGVGIAAQFSYLRVKDYVDDEHMHGITGSLVLSATYN